MSEPVPAVGPRWPALDGLRGLAAVAVVATHTAFWTGWDPGDLGGRLANRLDIGVAVFFVLSGFLLSRPFFVAAAQDREAPRAAAYLWRRALRVLPAYWVVVVASLWLLSTDPPADRAEWLGMLTLTRLYDGGVLAPGLTHTWSLQTEVAFYLVLPLLAAALVRIGGRGDRWRPRRVLAALAVLAVAGAGWLVASYTLWLDWAFDTGGQVPLWLPAYLGWFGAGMAIATVSVGVGSGGSELLRRAAGLGDHLGTCWGAAAALFLLSATTLAGPFGLATPTPAEAVVKNLLYLAVSVLVVWPLVFGDQSRGGARALLSTAPARFAGRISYGLFLVHLPLLAGLYAISGVPQFEGSFVLVLLLVLLVGSAVAWVSWVLVESPAQRLRGLVRAGPRRPPAASASAATVSSATD